jgi:hypothetical protein
MDTLPLIFSTLPNYYKSLNIEDLIIVDDYTITLNNDGTVNDALSRNAIDLKSTQSNEIVPGYLKLQDDGIRYRLMRIIFEREDYVDTFKQYFIFILVDTEAEVIEIFNPYFQIYHLREDAETNIFDALYEAGINTKYLVNMNDKFKEKYDKAYINKTDNMVFFSILYYLEYKLLNLDDDDLDVSRIVIDEVSRKDIMKYQYRMTSIMRKEIGTTPKKQGVLFCHGRIHNTEYVSKLMIKFGLDLEVDWIFVDTDYGAEPDVTGSFRSYNTIRTLQHFRYDYVMSINCPVYGSIIDVQRMVRAGRWLLRPGGSLIIPKLGRFMRKVDFEEDVLYDIMLSEYYNSYIMDGDDVLYSIS